MVQEKPQLSIFLQAYYRELPVKYSISGKTLTKSEMKFRNSSDFAHKRTSYMES
jgi:hypothetical protein